MWAQPWSLFMQFIPSAQGTETEELFKCCGTFAVGTEKSPSFLLVHLSYEKQPLKTWLRIGFYTHCSGCDAITYLQNMQKHIYQSTSETKLELHMTIVNAQVK